MGSMIASGRTCDKCSANAKFVHKRYDIAFCSHHMTEVPTALQTPEWEYIGPEADASDGMSDSSKDHPSQPGFTADDSLVSVYNGESEMPQTPEPIHMPEDDLMRYVQYGIARIESESAQRDDDIGHMHEMFALEANAASQDIAFVMHELTTNPGVLHERDMPGHE